MDRGSIDWSNVCTWGYCIPKMNLNGQGIVKLKAIFMTGGWVGLVADGRMDCTNVCM